VNRLRTFGPTLICFALIALQATWYWDKIPETVASHTDFAGRANGHQSKELFFAFEALLVFVTTGLLSLIAARLPQVKPELFNIPNKKYWLAPERAKRTIAFIQRRLRFMSTVTGLFTVLISQLVLDTNLKGHPLDQGSIVGLVAVFAVVIAGFSISMGFRFSRLPRN
jgi:uncharacterized membrane protein